MRGGTVMVLGLLLSSGCAKSVLPEFRAARQAALTDPGPPPPDWQPDAVLHLAPDLVDDVVASALETHGTLTGTLDAGVATVTPTLDVQQLTLGRSAGCAECLEVKATLDGDLAVASLLGRQRTDLTVDLVFDAVFDVAAAEAGVWTVTVTPRRLRDLEATVGGAALSYAAVPIREWVDDNLLAQVPPIRLAELGSTELPLRAVRVVPVGRTLQVQVLTSSPSPAAIPTDRTRPDGWQLDLAQDSLLDLARAAAFRHGEVGYAVVPEPTSLRIDGDAFVLGLRLWRTQGRGWWRDYTVRGTVAVGDDGIELVPGSVEEGDRSPGAVFVDPLAALGEGVILDTIEQALATSLPTSHRAAAEGLRTTVTLEEVTGEAGLVRATGELTVGAARARRR